MSSWAEHNIDSRKCVQCGKVYAPRQRNQICCGSRVCIAEYWADRRRLGLKLVKQKMYGETGNYIGPVLTRMLEEPKKETTS
jgi:hypothetical protein